MATLPEGYTIETPDTPGVALPNNPEVTPIQSTGNLPPGFTLESVPETQQQAQPTENQQQIPPRKQELIAEAERRGLTSPLEQIMRGEVPDLLKGYAGAVTRGAAPYAAGAMVGAGVGAPLVGVGAVPGAIAGMGAVALSEMVGDPIVDFVNAQFGTRYKRPTDALEDLLSKFGVAEPETEAQRIVESATRTAAGGGATAMLGKAVSGGKGIVAEAGKQLAHKPLQQVTGAAGAGAAGQFAQEEDMSTGGQLVAGVAGGVFGAGPISLKDIPSDIAATIKAGEETGVKILTSDVYPPRNFFTKWLQGVGEKIPVTGTGGARSKQVSQRIKAVENIVEEFDGGDVNILLKEVTDDALKNAKNKLLANNKIKTDIINDIGSPVTKQQVTALENTIKAIDDKILDLSTYGKLSTEQYDNLMAIRTQSMIKKQALVDEFAVKMTNTNTAIDEQIKALEGLDEKGTKQVIATLKDWKGSLNGQDIQNVEKLRSIIGESFKDNQSIRKLGEKALSKIYGPLREDMGNHIKKKSGESAFKAWKKANTDIAESINELEINSFKTLLKKGELEPETVATMLFNKKPSVFNHLFKSLTFDGRKSAKRALISKVAKDSIGDNGYQPNKFVKNLEKLSGNLAPYLTNTEKQQLSGLKRAVIATNRAPMASVAPPTGVQVAPLVGASVLTGLFGGPVAGIMATGGVGASASLYESKPIRDILVNIARTKVGSKEEAALVKRLIASIQEAKDE